jgi:amino-acid N-acetyltransferase
MENIIITSATIQDEKSIKQVLQDAELPYEDIDKHINNFLLAKKNGNVIGVVGLEISGEVGLFRSLAVALSHRGDGIGKLLTEKMFDYAYNKGVKQLYLLTKTAEGFFKKYGFENIERNSIPEAIKLTQEFKMDCCATAVCMTKNIERSL